MESGPRWPGRPPKAAALIQLLVKATLERLLAEPTIATMLRGRQERRDVLPTIITRNKSSALTFSPFDVDLEPKL